MRTRFVDHRCAYVGDHADGDVLSPRGQICVAKCNGGIGVDLLLCDVNPARKQPIFRRDLVIETDDVLVPINRLRRGGAVGSGRCVLPRIVLLNRERLL